MRHYSQLTNEQRYQIYALLQTNQSLSTIASVIGVHKSTVSREIRRNTGLRGYRPQQAQRLTDERRQHRLRPWLTSDHWRLIEALIRINWSPEQINGWLATSGHFTISHEWIYQYIYADKARGGKLHLHLRRQKKYGKRINGKSLRGQIPQRVSIDERPSIVDRKERIGDWEVYRYW